MNISTYMRSPGSRSRSSRLRWQADLGLPGGLISLSLPVLGLLGGLVIAGAVYAQGVTKTSILLGQSAPLSGSNREFGVDIRDGALAYFSKLNAAGGVHGRKIELVTLDDANDVARAGENTRVLTEEREVFALFGYASATLSRPALRGETARAVPRPIRGRRSDARIQPLRVQHARKLRRRTGEDCRLLRAPVDNAVRDCPLRRCGRAGEFCGRGPRAQKAQPRGGFGGGVQGPRQARHRGGHECGPQGQP